MRRSSWWVLVLFVPLGCSGSGASGGAIDCAWLASDNCWKMTIDDAAACLPPANEMGVLDAAGTTCTYASGAVVTFAQALALPLANGTPLNFTISKSGQSCLHYESTEGSIKVVVGAKTFSERATGGLGLQFTCPDGTSASNGNALDLLDCGADAGASLGGLPGDTYSSSPSSFSVGLIGTSSSSTPLFRCQR